MQEDPNEAEDIETLNFNKPSLSGEVASLPPVAMASPQAVVISDVFSASA